MKVLVLGASLNPDRYSNMAIKRLVDNDHEVLAVGLREGQVDTVTIQTGQPHFEDVDTITLYLNPVNQQAYYDYIRTLKPRRVIFNPGTENPEFFTQLQQEGVEIEIACTLVMLNLGVF